MADGVEPAVVVGKRRGTRAAGKAAGRDSAARLLRAHVASCTDVGRHRQNNEDSLLAYDLHGRKTLDSTSADWLEVKDPGLLLVVADGMGGMCGGETASQLCVEELPGALLAQLGKNGDASAALLHAIRDTHLRIYEASHCNEKLRGMGTTLTAALVRGRRAWVAQVGDSRAYRFGAGALEPLTRDQTIWNTLRESGQDPIAVLGEGPWQSTLTQAMGAQAEIRPVLSEVMVQDGDLLLLASDGLHRVVNDAHLTRILGLELELGEKARSLVAAANEGGGPDNISLILFEAAAEAGN